MATATVTSKGQITIPRQIREQLHLEEGDRVEFLVEEDGSVKMRPLSGSVKDLHGFLKRSDRRAVTVEEMNQGIAEHLAEENQRVRSSS